MNTPWFDYVGWAISANWYLPLIITWIYLLWLWKVSGDIKFEGWVRWRFIVPIARFRLISTKSWYAKLWKRFYGFGLFLAIIHRDEKGIYDDAWVEKTIVHEIRHVSVALILGLLMWISYGLIFLTLKIFTNKDAYRDNPYEIDARKAADRWEGKGRPRIYTFGERR